MGRHDAAADGQAQADAVVRIRNGAAVLGDKGFKQMLLHFFGDAFALVTHGDIHRIPVGVGLQADDAAFRRMPGGVLQQVDDALDDQLAVHLRGDHLIRQEDLELVRAHQVAGVLRCLLDDVVDDFVLFLDHQFVLADAGHVQNILHQVVQPGDLIADVGGQLAALAVAERIVVLAEQAAGAV